MRCAGLFILLVWAGGLPCSTRGADYPVGARSWALARASVMLVDFWCITHNQGGLGWLERPVVGFTHQSGYIPETDHQILGVALPCFAGCIGGSLSLYGYEHYQQYKAAIAYGRYLSPKLAGGIQIDYYHTRISGVYGQDHRVTFEAGLLLRANDQLVLGAHLFNPVSQTWGRYQEPLPVIIRLGAGIHFSRPLQLLVEVEKQPGQVAIPKMGFEYAFSRFFFLRTGVSLNPTLHCFGIGYHTRHLQADMAYAFHPVLGGMPHLSMAYAF